MNHSHFVVFMNRIKSLRFFPSVKRGLRGGSLLISATHLPMTFSLSAHLAYKLYTQRPTCILPSGACATRPPWPDQPKVWDMAGNICTKRSGEQVITTRLWAICVFFFLYFVLDITQKPLVVECQSVATIEGTALNTDFSLFLAN